MKEDFLLFQINDASFPIGAYSHSYGLETYIQKDYIQNSEDVYKYIKSNIENSFLYTELLGAYKAYRYAEEGNTDKILNLEEILEAGRVSCEIRTANEKLGSRFIKTVSSLNIEFKSSVFEKYIKEDINHTHCAAYGVFCYAAGIEIKKAMERYLFSYVSAMVINSVKLIPLSQTEGQKILYKCTDFFEKVINKLEKLSEDDLMRSAPGFDIRSMQHERLYSRLYMS